MQLCSIPNCSSSLIYPILDLSYRRQERGIGAIIDGWYTVRVVDGSREVVFVPLSMGSTCSRRAVYIVDDPGSSRRGQGGHPRTSVLGLRGASLSLCGHRLLHRHRLDRFVAVGLHSPLLGLDIHYRWVSFAVVALDWPPIHLVVVEAIWSLYCQCWATSTSRLAVGVIVGVNVSSMGRMFRRWALCVTVGCYVSSMSGVCCRWAIVTPPSLHSSLKRGADAHSWERVSTRSVGRGWSTAVGIRCFVKYGGLGYSG